MKKIKSKKEKTKSNKKKIIILLVLILIIGSIVGFLYYKKVKATNSAESKRIRIEEEERIEIKEKLILESGSEVPTIDSFIEKRGKLSENTKISYENTDEGIEDKDLQQTTLFFNESSEKVAESDALDGEGNIKESYTSKSIVTGIGTYKVTILDETLEEEYTSSLDVIDTTNPEVTTKDVEITENDDITEESFIESCIDNSNTKCSYHILRNNEEVNLKELKEGEYNLTLVATDISSNEVRKDVKLVVKKKETKPATSSSNKDTTSIKKPSGSSSSKPSTSTNSNSSSSSNASSSSNSGTCTPSVMLPNGKQLSGSEIVYYKKWNTPITYQEYDAWKKANPSMTILQDEAKHRMKQLTTNLNSAHYGGRTYGDYYGVTCGGLYYGAVLYIRYAPPTWTNAEHTAYQNTKVQGEAYLDSNQSPHWLYRNFESGWWPNQFRTDGYAEDFDYELNTGDKNPR